MPPKQLSTAQLIKKLIALSRQFGDDTAGEKIAVLKQLERARLTNAEQIQQYHDTLCFMRAYPDNYTVEKLADGELRKFSARITALKKRGSKAALNSLDNSGIANTTTTHPFGYEISQLLKSRYGSRVKLCFDENQVSWADKLIDYLPLIVAWQENDSIDNDDDFDLEEFLRRARGRSHRDDLKGLLQLIGGSDLPIAVQRFFFESLDLESTWELSTSKASRTLCRVPSLKRFYFDAPLLKRCADLRAELKEKPSPIVRLSEAKGKEIIAITSELLAVRNRELYPVTLANPSEIFRIEPGRGLQIYLFATPPRIRLPLEANFGAMFTRNGMPVGYGIAATLFDRVEIAMNVFPAFRAGESAYMIEQFFRVFYHHFGSRVFLVRSMQMGNDEEEALHSGAFWFYYKLGFRAVSASVRRLADKEYAKQIRRKGYRTPLRTQKQLAVSDVVLLADDASKKTWREPSLVNLGYVVTDYFSRVHNGDRKSGTEKAVAGLLKSLGVKNTASWNSEELLALRRLAPLLVNIKGIVKWKPKEKKNLVSIIRARGSGLERDYCLQCLKHQKLQKAIESLARSR